MNTLNPIVFAINYPEAIPSKLTNQFPTVDSLTEEKVNMIHTFQKLWADYEEARFNKDLWSFLYRFFKLESIQRQLTGAQQRLVTVESQLAQHTLSQKPFAESHASGDYAKLLSQLALDSVFLD